MTPFQNPPPDPAEFRQVLGLSCVENQVLLYLLHQGMDIRHTYEDSLPSLSAILENMLIRGKSYTEADVVPRIQQRLRERGLLSLSMKREEVGSLLHQLSHCEENLVLMQVTSDFAVKDLLARGWRDDHFVRLFREGEGALLLNDIPPLLRPLSSDELRRAYAGRYLVIRPHHRGIPPPKGPAAFRSWFASPPVDARDAVNGIDRPMQYMQEIVFFYKVMRRRAEAYASLFMDTKWMGEPLHRIEVLQMKISYQLLHGQFGAEPASEILERLCRIDEELAGGLKEKTAGLM